MNATSFPRVSVVSPPPGSLVSPARASSSRSHSGFVPFSRPSSTSAALLPLERARSERVEFLRLDRDAVARELRVAQREDVRGCAFHVDAVAPSAALAAFAFALVDEGRSIQANVGVEFIGVSWL